MYQNVLQETMGDLITLGAKGKSNVQYKIQNPQRKSDGFIYMKIKNGTFISIGNTMTSYVTARNLYYRHICGNLQSMYPNNALFVRANLLRQVTNKIMFQPWLVWLSCLEHHPIDQKEAGSIPGQGTHPGCGFESQWDVYQKATHINVSLLLSLKAMKKMSSGKD